MNFSGISCRFFAWATSCWCMSKFFLTFTFFRWGQVFILDALSRYKAADAREAENIVERVTPRLQHANCAVVLSAVKVTCFQRFVAVLLDCCLQL